MHHSFMPLMALVVLPLFAAGASLRLFARAAFRWSFAAVLAAVLAVSVAAGGMDFVYLKRVKLFLALAVVALLALRRLGAWRFAVAARYRAGLLILAALSGIVYFNFFSFHGTGTTRAFVHLHDVAHYYLGAKYFAELGYTDLYAAMLRAGAEDGDAAVRVEEVRDLRTYELVAAARGLRDGAVAKANFTPSRWRAFAALFVLPPAAARWSPDSMAR
jgi:hypothetical protein